ncbi:hypothetical protein [Psychromonas ossibalaenae]|uniref:hypothetical protein n=1 Tax=Psychromonas ossibalaenae TaxID=444922 RepID=UPI00036CE751|nr:hypothetical protein [Psychromonas ossibalaenae]
MNDSTEKNTVTAAEISELLDDLMLELRFHGLELQDKLIHRTLDMQERLKLLNKKVLD